MTHLYPLLVLFFRGYGLGSGRRGAQASTACNPCICKGGSRLTPSTAAGSDALPEKPWWEGLSRSCPIGIDSTHICPYKTSITYSVLVLGMPCLRILL